MTPSERKLARRLKQLENELETKATLPDASSSAFEERQRAKTIREIKSLIKNDPLEPILSRILELIDDTKNQLQPSK